MAARQLGMKPHLVLRWPGEIVSDVVARRLGIMEWCSVQEDLIIYPVVKLLLRHYGNCMEGLNFYYGTALGTCKCSSGVVILKCQGTASTERV